MALITKKFNLTIQVCDVDIDEDDGIDYGFANTSDETFVEELRQIIDSNSSYETVKVELVGEPL